MNPNAPVINAELDRRCERFAKDPCGAEDKENCTKPGEAIGKYFFEVNDINFFPTIKQVEDAKTALKEALKLFETLIDAFNEEAKKNEGSGVKLPSIPRLSGLAANGTTALVASEGGVDVYKFGGESKIEFTADEGDVFGGNAGFVGVFVMGLVAWLI